MTATVSDIVTVLETLAPVHLAEEWDNVGLQVGHPDWPAKRVLVALDPTPAVVEEAIQADINVLVTHHPLIFRPLRNLNLATPTGSIIQRLMTRRVAVIAAHTNLDSVQGGINDVLVKILALQNIEILQAAPDDEHAGLGRVGELLQPMAFEALVQDIKQRMALAHIRFAGQPAGRVQRVAVCSGSGGGLLEVFLKSAADVFVTGDVRYHDAREIEAHHRGVIDIGHFESERIIVQHLAKRLAAQLKNMGRAVRVEEAACEVTPFKVL
jgi:dinuclear metal center YbgI/SA1388 family protein